MRFLFAFAFALCATSGFAGALVVEVTTDKPKAIYAPGEKMVFSLRLLDDGKPVDGVKFKWVRNGDDGKSTSGEGISFKERPLVVETSLSTPGFVRIQATALNEKGEALKNDRGHVKFDGGAGVEIEKVKGYPEPKDFDEYWAKQKAKLEVVPMKASIVEIESKDPQYQVFDVKVDAPGGKQVVGYLRKPKGAALKSLPALVGFDYYAVHSLDAPIIKSGYITLNFNTHGIENRKDESYYKALREGPLKNYAFNKEENSNPETAYSNGMCLRLMRALEFIKSQPEWDGKNLTAQGGSQGGFQSLIAAGLDGDVSRCEAYCPAFCDINGYKFNAGRMQTIFHAPPDSWKTDALDYFDPANHAKRIKCETVISAGLGDYICPPSGVMVVYNNINAPKTLTFTQGQTHDYLQKLPQDPQKFSLSSK